MHGGFSYGSGDEGTRKTEAVYEILKYEEFCRRVGVESRKINERSEYNFSELVTESLIPHKNKKTTLRGFFI
jgi:hypothetical protein